MEDTHRFGDHDIDAALDGRSSNPDLDEVAEWAGSLRRVGSAGLDDAVASAHLAAAISAVRVADPVGGRSSAATYRRRRRFVLSTFLSTLAGKIIAGGVALAAVTGGVAATGTLPDAIQDPLADVYQVVGFDFPSSDDVPGERSDDVDGDEDHDRTVGIKDEMSDDDHGDDDTVIGDHDDDEYDDDEYDDDAYEDDDRESDDDTYKDEDADDHESDDDAYDDGDDDRHHDAGTTSDDEHDDDSTETDD